MSKILLKVLNIIVICGGIFLLQWHGIKFWITAVDIHTGIWWSILIELVNFWAWFQVKEIKLRKVLIRFIAICTTFLLLVGPIYIVSLEIIKELEISNQELSEFQRKKEVLEEELIQKREQSDRLLGIIENTKDGWKTYNKLTDSIESIVKDLNEMEKPEIGSSVSTQKIAIVLLQIFSVLIFQLAIILSITKIGGSGVDNTDINSYSELLRRRKEMEKNEN